MSDDAGRPPGPATGAMRLRPAARSVPTAHRDRLEQLADAITRLHRPLEIGHATLCRECLLPHPCRTVRLVHPGTDTHTPREESAT